MFEPLLHTMQFLPRNTAIAGLMRHAERAAIPVGEFGNELALTPAGEKHCQLLAKQLPLPLEGIFSSPIKRCVQTAEILSTSQPSIPIHYSNFLGDPGIFIQNPQAVHAHFLQYQPLEIVQQLLNPQPNPAGFCTATDATIYQLVVWLLQKITNQHLTLFITHDSILSVVLGVFFNDIPLDVLWPDYLETLFIWQQQSYLHLVYRDHCKKILWQL